MIVEVIGGPRDGMAVEVPDGIPYLRIPVPTGVAAALYAIAEDVDLTEMDIKILTLEIYHTSNGRRHYVMWKEI